MKIGMRTPNIKKSIKARTTGRAKRAVKRAVNPLYGKKGMGFAKDPERSIKNAVYKRTTFSVSDVAKSTAPKRRSTGKTASPHQDPEPRGNTSNTGCVRTCTGLLFAIATPLCLFDGTQDIIVNIVSTLISAGIAWWLLKPLWHGDEE